MKITVVWDVTQYSLVDVYQYLEGAYSLDPTTSFPRRQLSSGYSPLLCALFMCLLH
jgi:hypothetical protein